MATMHHPDAAQAAHGPAARGGAAPGLEPHGHIAAHVERGWKRREDPFGQLRHSCTVVLPGGIYVNAFISHSTRRAPEPLFPRRLVAIVDKGTHHEVLVDPATGRTVTPAPSPTTAAA